MHAKYIKPPSRHSQPEEWKRLTPKETKHWVKALPTADYAQMAELLLERLRKMNRIEEASPLDLFDNAELIRPATYELLNHFIKKPIGTKFPLSDENRNLSEVLLNISTELATSYWSITECLLKTPVEKRLKKNGATIVQRALTSLGQIILLHYLYKQAEPDGIWLDIHQLFITFQHYSKNSITDNVRELPKTSLLGCYKQLLLLRLAQPYKLLQAEIIELFFLLEKWTELVQLDLLDKKLTEKKTSCLINFQSDSSANWQPFLGHINLSNLLRLLNDYEEFVDDSVGRFETSASKDLQLSISPGLIHHLETCWSGHEPPIERLFDENSSRICTIGLTAIYQSLTSQHEERSVTDYELLADTVDYDKLKITFPVAETLSLGQLIAFRQLGSSRQKLTLAITTDIRYDGTPIQFQLYSLTNRPYPAQVQQYDGGDHKPHVQPAIIYFTLEKDGSKKTWIIIESKAIKLGDKIQLITSNKKLTATVIIRRHIGTWCYLLQCDISKAT